MKVYIAVDSEGSACIVREKDPETVYGTWQAEYIRKQATAEAAAAVEGAREAGATDILVHDVGFIRGHSPIGLVLHYDDLPHGIQIALGGAAIKQVIDESFDAAILLGHHAMAGTSDGVLAHTFSSASVEKMTLNGEAIGEIAIEALQIGHFGVPVVMVSADEAGCREAKEWLGEVEIAPTKRGLATHQAVSLHPADACELIRSQACAALSRLQDFTPFALDPPYELLIDCFTRQQARIRAESKGGEFVPPRGCFIKTDNCLDLI